MAEPTLKGPGKRLLAVFARVSRWPYTDYSAGGNDRFPAPARPGIPESLTFDDPTEDARPPNGIVCSSLTALEMAGAYPDGRWTTPDEVGGDVSTYARMQGFRMAAHLAAGGTVDTAPPEVLWDPIDAAVEVGAGRKRLTVDPLDQVPVGYWVLAQGWWSQTRGHAFVLFRYSDDLWMQLESSGEGPRIRWRTTAWLEDRFDAALGLAVLRNRIPAELKRAAA